MALIFVKYLWRSTNLARSEIGWHSQVMSNTNVPLFLQHICDKSSKIRHSAQNQLWKTETTFHITRMKVAYMIILTRLLHLVSVQGRNVAVGCRRQLFVSPHRAVDQFLFVPRRPLGQVGVGHRRVVARHRTWPVQGSDSQTGGQRHANCWRHLKPQFNLHAAHKSESPGLRSVRWSSWAWRRWPRVAGAVVAGWPAAAAAPRRPCATDRRPAAETSRRSGCARITAASADVAAVAAAASAAPRQAARSRWSARSAPAVAASRAAAPPLPGSSRGSGWWGWRLHRTWFPGVQQHRMDLLTSGYVWLASRRQCCVAVFSGGQSRHRADAVLGAHGGARRVDRGLGHAHSVLLGLAQRTVLAGCVWRLGCPVGTLHRPCSFNDALNPVPLRHARMWDLIKLSTKSSAPPRNWHNHDRRARQSRRPWPRACAAARTGSTAAGSKRAWTHRHRHPPPPPWRRGWSSQSPPSRCSSRGGLRATWAICVVGLLLQW